MCAGGGGPVRVPRPILPPAITGIGGKNAEGDLVHHRTLGVEQPYLVAVIVQDDAGHLAIENCETAGLDDCFSWDEIGRAVAFVVVQKPIAQIHRDGAPIV